MATISISRLIVLFRPCMSMQLTETGSAKLFVKSDESTVVITPGQLTDKELRIVRAFIKDNYKEMYIKWSEMSNEGFYRGK